MKTASIIPKTITEYDLRLLRIFVTVVEHGGFSTAANALNITRSTVSIHMANLEERMGLKLCLRGRSGFSLTEEGQAVYRAILDVFDSLNDFSLLVGTLRKELSGEIVILCAEQLDRKKQQKLSDVIEHIHQVQPSLQIVLDNAPISHIEKSLLKDKAHVGIFPCYQSIEGLNYTPLSSEPIFLCCGAKHPFFSKVDSQITDVELKNTATIHPGVDVNLEGKTQLEKLNLCARSYQFDMRKTLILSGQYLGFMPQSHIQDELNNGEIRLIRPDQLTYPFELSLVSKKLAREKKKVALLQNSINRFFLSAGQAPHS